MSVFYVLVTGADQHNIPVISAVLDIAEEALHERDTWLRQQATVHSLKVLLGRALER